MAEKPPLDHYKLELSFNEKFDQEVGKAGCEGTREVLLLILWKLPRCLGVQRLVGWIGSIQANHSGFIQTSLDYLPLR